MALTLSAFKFSTKTHLDQYVLPANATHKTR